MKRLWEDLRQGRVTVPSWFLSLVFHALLLVLLGTVIRAAPRGLPAERVADVGIVLRHEQGDQVAYEAGEETGGPSEAAALATSASAASLDEVFRDQPPVDTREALPSALAVIGPGALESGGVGSAQGAAAGGSVGRGAGGLNRGAARAGFFGIEKEGFKFVYVVDRSGSMGGSGRNALDAAKEQLLASLDDLGDLHQFQIIFYNDEPPWVFNPSDLPGRLALATEPNKTRARRFIGSVTAAGGTRHEEALLAAIRLQPDVIFFLTDAQEPKLTPRQLDRIRQRNHGISINAVEFGFGPQSDSDNFLVRLARENDGEHVYVDVSKLFPAGN